MNLELIIGLLQCVCLLFQLYCLYVGIKKEDIMGTFYGFAIWGVIPNLLLNMVGKML